MRALTLPANLSRGIPWIRRCRSQQTPWVYTLSRRSRWAISVHALAGGPFSMLPVERNWVETGCEQCCSAAMLGGIRHSLVSSSAKAPPCASLAHLVIDDDGDIRLLRNGTLGDLVGRRLRIHDASDMANALDTVYSTVVSGEGQPWVLMVEASDWKVIPVENLIAAVCSARLRKGSAPHGVKLLARVSSAAEARLLLNTLESGVDGVVLATDEKAEVEALIAYDASRRPRDTGRGLSSDALELCLATILAKPRMIETADRVCVDLVESMSASEGLLVGSCAGGLFLVHSECLTNEFIATRAFRVNAGPVCSYVLTPGNRTSYLSELKAGSEVLVVSEAGNFRVGVVGRVKVERRPMLMIEATDNVTGRTWPHFLQNAETVCLVQLNASRAAIPIRVGDLVAGDQVLLWRGGDGGRHTGLAINEWVEER